MQSYNFYCTNEAYFLLNYLYQKIFGDILILNL